jgi:glutathione synthase/RimK-type ligase-like ATP-grasp enzyme
MLLIVTNKNDSHADAAIRAFGADERNVFRLNTEDLLTRYVFRLRVEDNGRWSGTIENERGRTVSLPDVRSAWFRKPDFALSGPQPSEDRGIAEFIVSEAKSLVEILYTLPGVTWVNDPFAAQRAKVKFRQILLAREIGLATPKTLITRDPDAALDFALNCAAGVLTKAVYTSNVTLDGVNHGILSKRVSPEEFEAFAPTVALCPTLLQEYCEKAFELRVTVIGDRVFPVRIDSQEHADTRVDWRADTFLSRHSKFDLPDTVREACLTLVRRQGLLYGAIDLIVTPGGDYVFLENNPYGNYQWLEAVTDFDLTGAMVDLLSRPLASSAPSTARRRQRK